MRDRPRAQRRHTRPSAVSAEAPPPPDSHRPDWPLAARLIRESRHCPRCSTARKPWLMVAKIVRERIGGPFEREVIGAAQVRWKCGLCHFGEIVTL